MGYFTDNEDELQHHGIKGQKWGIRRFQREDGTRTPAGKLREREDDDDPSSGNTEASGGHSSGFNIDKQALMKGAAIAGAVTLGAVLITNPGARNVLGKYGKTAMVSLGSAAGKGAATFMNKAPGVAKKVGDDLAKRASKVGDAALDAALASTAAIAVAKVTDRLAVSDDATEAEKNRSKVMTDVATAAINAAANSSKSSSKSGGNNKGGSVGKEITDKLGSPTHKAVDTSGPEYQNLINSTTDKEIKNQIKSLRKQGYDMDQLQKAMDELKHSMFEDWVSQYMAVEIGW